jgi:hypothetical protein
MSKSKISCKFEYINSMRINGWKLRFSLLPHLTGPRMRPLVVECLSLVMRWIGDTNRSDYVICIYCNLSPHISLDPANKIGNIFLSFKLNQLQNPSDTSWVLTLWSNNPIRKPQIHTHHKYTLPHTQNLILCSPTHRTTRTRTTHPSHFVFSTSFTTYYHRSRNEVNAALPCTTSKRSVHYLVYVEEVCVVYIKWGVVVVFTYSEVVFWLEVIVIPKKRTLWTNHKYACV